MISLLIATIFGIALFSLACRMILLTDRQLELDIQAYNAEVGLEAMAKEEEWLEFIEV